MANEPPVAKLTGPTRGQVGVPVRVDGSQSQDDVRIKRGRVQWGDGDTTAFTGQPGAYEHTYRTADTYTITLTVEDQRKGLDTDALTVAIVEAVIVEPPPTGAELPLVTADGPVRLKLLGMFRPPPSSPDDGSTAAYGGRAMAFNPDGDGGRGSIFFTGHEHHLKVGEMSIPELGMDFAALPVARYLQPFFDPMNGLRTRDLIQGLLVDHGKLISTELTYYDAQGSQNATKLSHFVKDGLTAADPVVGPLEVTAEKTNNVSGYMTPIPAYAQRALKGTALTGWCMGPSIIRRTSQGPAISAFNPDELGLTQPCPATTLLQYPEDHPTLGDWSTPTPWPPEPGKGENHTYNGTATCNGVAFPPGTRSVLFFGSMGFGTFCYGDATNDPEKVWTFTDAGQKYCIYDPAGPYGHTYWSIDPAKKGETADYRFVVWAYDALDLAAVAAGTKQAWEPVPYAVLPLEVPDAPWHTGTAYQRISEPSPRGVCIDPARGILYFHRRAGEFPVIYAYGLTGITPGLR